MKKLVCTAVCLALLLGCCAGAEETADFSFGMLDGLIFEHASGAGAWAVELEIAEDGSFTGSCHDSDMGDTGDRYPNGTVYTCRFHGRFSAPEAVSATALRMTVAELALDAGQALQTIEDGIRYVLSPPALKEGDAVTLYLPGQPTAEFSEEFLFWLHLDWYGEACEALPFYALRVEADDAGYVGFACGEDIDDGDGTPGS